ncbi:integrase [Avibacterium gallinarum]|uniref:integrase n=1 Tax=Avibacterium gallinarum TaxID=755 RepID=UPI003BF884B1
MATVTKSTTGWRVKIRKKGIYKSGTFRTKAEAQAWANKIESEINAGTYSNIPDITFADLIDKYIKEITVHKKSKREETLRLTRLAAMDIGKIKLAELTEQDFIAWRDERLSMLIHVISLPNVFNSSSVSFTCTLDLRNFSLLL